jgi:hypothetical protein
VAKRYLDKLSKSDQVLIRLLAATGMRLSEAFEIDGELKEWSATKPTKACAESRSPPTLSPIRKDRRGRIRRRLPSADAEKVD